MHLRATAADADVGVAGVLAGCDRSVLKKALEELLKLDEDALPEVEEEVAEEAPRR